MATTELGEDPTVPSVLGRLGPNWFASVMGTGIVANAAATLPVHIHGLRAFAEAVWVLAVVLLIVLIIIVGAVRTARGSLQGNLFQPPSTVPVKAHKDPVT